MKLIIGIIHLILLLLVASAGLIFHKGCGRRKGAPVPHASAARPDYDTYILQGRSWFFAQQPITVHTHSRDGMCLQGYYLPGQGDTTLILMHGYHAEAVYEFAPLVQFYHEQGYNLLLPDQRAHGGSEGKYLSFGIKESEDVVCWAQFLNETYAPEHLFLSGISMGGATVCMSALRDLPDNVRGIIADCPFGDPGRQFRYSLSHRFHLPGGLFLYLCGIWSRILGGWHFTDLMVEDYRKAALPLLILHGTADPTVPHILSEDIERHYGGKVQRELFEGCAHAYAYLSDTPRYQKLVLEFIHSLEKID